MGTTTPQSDADPASLLREALRWHEQGYGVALASVLCTWGSSPCPPGSQLLIREDMRFEGSVSGGCVETDVISQAVELLSTPMPGPRCLTYGVSDEEAFGVGLACGGSVEICLQRIGDGLGDLSPALLEQVIASVEQRAPVAITCALAGGACELHLPGRAAADDDGSLASLVATSARHDRSGRCEDYFIKVFNPRLRLVLVGAVHIAQHLAAMAQRCHYAVSVVDPREVFLRERFEGVETSSQWPDEALQHLALDARTAVVTLTHDPKLDDPALDTALRSDAFYIGALGSRRTQAKRQARLLALGHGDDAIARVHGPVGLDLGAQGPAEIAVSILAQITATLRTRVAST